MSTTNKNGEHTAHKKKQAQQTWISDLDLRIARTDPSRRGSNGFETDQKVHKVQKSINKQYQKKKRQK